MEEDLELIKEIGANCIRLAHYQHDQHIYDLCDKYGIIIWTEIPYISKHSSNGFDNIKQQLQELILQIIITLQFSFGVFLIRLQCSKKNLTRTL